MAGSLTSKRIKRSHYKTDAEFVAALLAAGKKKQAEQYLARKEREAARK
jgi:hypothetical protein